MKTLVGDCRDESLIEEIFGSVTVFAQLVEEKGNNFSYGNYRIKYNEKEDIHYFYYSCH